jgi:hypothetical protein
MLKIIVSVIAVLLFCATDAQAAKHHRTSAAYRAALNVGLGGDWYGPRPTNIFVPGTPTPPIATPPPSWGGQRTRVYLMRGLGHLSNFAPLSRDLRATGAIVEVTGWANRNRIVHEALRHPGDRIIVGGHSQGGKSAFIAGADIQRRGVKVHVISLDPLCTFPQSSPGLWGTNIWGNNCLGRPATVAGAENIFIGGISHIPYPTAASVRSQFVQATYWN